MEPEKVETEEEKRARIAAKSEEYREKIDEAREQKQADFKESEKQKEKERREVGQKVAEQYVKNIGRFLVVSKRIPKNPQ